MRQPLFRMLHMFIHVSQHIQQKILGKAAGVNAELVVSQIVPLPVCEELVVGFSGFTHFFYQGAGALFFTSKASITFLTRSS